MLGHVPEVPIVSRKALVNRRVGHRRAVVELQRRRVVAGGREIEAPHARTLEWWRRIIRGVDRASQHRWRRNNRELVTVRHIEELLLAAVGNGARSRITIPL